MKEEEKFSGLISQPRSHQQGREQNNDANKEGILA
jgi:hypothetical protein